MSHEAAERPCPCGSRAPLRSCCGPYLTGQRRAPTAEALMRSRYSAYSLGEEAYLLATWDPATRPAQLQLQGDGIEWTGLNVVRCEAGGAADQEGQVEFVAHLRQHGQERLLHERSRFRRIDGAWVYVDGALEHRRPVVAGPKVGRNDPCPCGSGKKAKRCCER